MNLNKHTCVTLLCLYSFVSSTSAAENKPNILLMVADDLGYADLGCQGATDLKTPHLDSIAKNGVRFTSGYVSAPVCSPSRAGLMTGRYPTRFGHEFNHALADRSPDGVGLPLTEKTAAQWFKEAGYVTGHVGKWHLGNPSFAHYTPNARGFDESFHFPGANKLPPLVFNFNGKAATAQDRYVDEAMAREAAGFVERHRAEPWFLYVAFLTPHQPLQTPPGAEDGFASIQDPERRKCAALLALLDGSAGRILKALRETGQEERTLIVFLGDNGPTTHNGSRATPLSSGKNTTWEGGIRVPFVMQWKGGLPAGRVVDVPVFSLDILPTALTAAGVDVPANARLDGVNLLPFLTGRTSQPPHDALFWRFGGQWAVRAGDWKLLHANIGTGHAQTTVHRLVNLAADAAERHDLSTEQPAKLAELQTLWDEWNAKNVPALWPNGSNPEEKPKREANLAFPEPMASWPETEKDRQREAARKLVKDMNAAVARGATEFTVPHGDYRFGVAGPKNLELTGATNLHVNAAGATFWLEPRQRVDAIRIRNCKNVRLTGLTVDYDPAAYAQGEITAIDPKAKTVDIRIDTGFPLPDAGWTAKDGSIKAIFFDPAGQMREVRMDWIKSLEPRGGREFRVTFKNDWMFVYNSDIRVGDRLCLPDRSMRMAVMVENSESVTLEDVTIYASPHIALAEVGGKGGHVYRRCKVIRRPGTQRLMACNADVFRSIQAVRGPTIEGCEFAHAGDDLINIHGFFFLVLEQKSPTQVVIVQHFGRGFDAGSELEFFDWNNLAPLGGAKVKALTEIKDAAVLEAARQIPAEVTKRGDRLFGLHPHNIWPYLVELDRPVTVKKLDLVGCEDRTGRGAVIRDNHFHDGFCRAVLSKPSDAIIERNRIERMGMGGILVEAERFWLEGPFAHHVTIRDNTLTDCGLLLDSRLRFHSSLGAINVLSVGGLEFSPGIHNHHIEITGNKIVRPGICGIFVAHTRDSRIEDNVIESPCARKPIRQQSPAGIKVPGHAIFLAVTENVTVRNNTVRDPTEYCSGEVGHGPMVK